jgi:hypothetical protein
MPFIFKRLALYLSIAAAFAADKDAAFRPGPAASYPHHQTNAKVTIGADPYLSGEKVKAAFGKLDPYQYGVLPVLVVIQNDGDRTLRLKGMKAEYVGPHGDRVPATPASDVRYARAPSRPGTLPTPVGTIALKGKKNPLDAWEIEGRAFTAEMLPAGNSASGFVYFQTPLQRGSTIYLSGIAEAASGIELFYFEIPIGDPLGNPPE